MISTQIDRIKQVINQSDTEALTKTTVCTFCDQKRHYQGRRQTNLKSMQSSTSCDPDCLLLQGQVSQLHENE